MKVLLTGPFGKIGYRVIEALLAKGHQVLCFDLDTPINRKTARDFEERVQVIWGNIMDEQAVKNAVTQVEVVIHNAALIPPATDRNVTLSEKINVGGTQTIIAAIETQDKKPLLIFPSSISVHGLQDLQHESVVSIDDPIAGEDNYAKQKVRCEHLIEQSSIPWVVARIGACMEGSTRLPMRDSLELMHLMFSLHPGVRLEFIHTKDAALAIVNAIDNPAAVGKKFFLGGGISCQTHWREFNLLAMNAIGIKDFSVEDYGQQSYYTHWMDTTESQRVLQFQQHSLVDYKQELDASYRWFRFFTKPFSGLLKWAILKYAKRSLS